MAIQSLIIILLVLAGLLTLGVPISYAIGISSLTAIVRIMPFDVAVLTAAQRTFVGMSKFSLTAIPFFILAGNHDDAKLLYFAKEFFRKANIHICTDLSDIENPVISLKDEIKERDNIIVDILLYKLYLI